MIRPYFPSRPGSDGAAPPLPLRKTVPGRVRFEEADALGVVWHGRYASYAEDARAALFEACGVGYLDFHRNGVITPIKNMRIDYLRPLRFGDTFEVEGVLHWNDAVRLDFEFAVRDAQGELAASGCTVQLMLDQEGRLLLLPPPFYAEFRERWRRGVLSALQGAGAGKG
jgi:acyl-CoA thioester hydrolase